MESHHHNHEAPGLSLAFTAGIALNLAFIVAEVIYGFASNSMALVADAGHNLSDVLALVFSWLAVIISRRKPTLRFTYGLRRSTILSALMNTLLLLVAVFIILWETLNRMGTQGVVNADNVMIVAGIGILINGITAWMFMRDRKHDINIKSAFLHFVADTLVSAGVVVAGLVIKLTGLPWIDTVVSLIIVVIILIGSYRLLIDSVALALDGVPRSIDMESVRNFLSGYDSIVTIHDLHVWAISTTETALTVHLVTSAPLKPEQLRDLREQLKSRFNIHHSTIQIEARSEENCDDPCN